MSFAHDQAMWNSNQLNPWAKDSAAAAAPTNPTYFYPTRLLQSTKVWTGRETQERARILVVRFGLLSALLERLEIIRKLALDLAVIDDLSRLKENLGFLLR
jgi:hypothetical protein